MISVRKNSKLLLASFQIVFFVGCCSCSINNASNSFDDYTKSDSFYIDALGDSKVDTLIVRQNKHENKISEINTLMNGVEQRIISILPRLYNGEEVLAYPQIETISLSTNFTQSEDKELRITIRNTDLIPDYLFIDLKFDKIWIVKRYYLCNTNKDTEIFIRCINIEKPLHQEWGKELIVDQNYIINLFDINES